MIRRVIHLAFAVTVLILLSGCAEPFRTFGPPDEWKPRQVTIGVNPRQYYYGLMSGDANTQCWSLLGLARRGDTEAVPVIVLKLNPDLIASPLVRSTAAVALSMLGDPRAIPYLENACDDPAGVVRADAVTALSVIGGTAQTPCLVRVLSGDTEERVRLHAARGLARIGGKEAVAALVAHLDDFDEGVVFECHRALVTISGQDLPPRKSAWTEWMEENT